MHPRYRCLITAVLLPVYLGSCTQWYVRPVTPEQVQTLQEEEPAKIRVTLADSTRLEFDHIGLAGDSIVGRNGNGAEARWQIVAIDQVVLLETAPSASGAVHGLAGSAVAAVVTSGLVILALNAMWQK